MKESDQKLLYTTLTCQTLSTDGRFLFVGSSFGDVAIFCIDKLSTSPHDESSEPISVSNCSELGQIYSLAFHSGFLIVGTSGLITGYTWCDKTHKLLKKAWTIQLPIGPEAREMDEVNDLWVDKENNLLFAGCGDNNIYSCSLEGGSIVRKFTGHSDYIHTIDGNENQIISGSEEGSVKVWDQREKDVVFTVEPFKDPQINRNGFGKWIGTVSLSKDWFLSGGGPRLALFHLRSRQPLQIFDFPQALHVSDFVEENILAGGDHKNLYQYSFKGDVVSEVQISGSSVYSVVWQNTPPNKIMTMCGTSNNIDVSTNFTYKDTTLSFYRQDTTVKIDH